MEIIGLLAFIALVAVIFGVTMHEAFWGIILFIALGILTSILILFIKAGAVRIGNKVAYMKTPKGKAEQKQNIKNFIANLFWAFIIFCLVSPLLIEALISAVFKDFAEQNPLPTFLIAIAPCLTAIAVILVYAFKNAKKRTSK